MNLRNKTTEFFVQYGFCAENRSLVYDFQAMMEEENSYTVSAKQRRLHQGTTWATPRPPLSSIHRKQTIPNENSQHEYKSCNDDYDAQGNEDNSYTQLKERRRHKSDHGSSTRSFIILGLIFILSVLALLLVYLNFPELDEDERDKIKLPKDIEDAKNLGKVLSRYRDKYFYQVLFGYFITYIFLQSFAIPGSIFLSIISGFLYPFPLALSLVCLCSGIGASFCYLLSYLVGRRLVNKYIPERVAEWQSHVERHKDHLLNYIIFLRITPFLPNWFINITSPVLNVPLTPFFLGTFLGVAPPSFVAIQAGTTLHKLTSSGDALTWSSILILALLALLALLPVILKNKLKKRFD